MYSMKIYTNKIQNSNIYHIFYLVITFILMFFSIYHIAYSSFKLIFLPFLI